MRYVLFFLITIINIAGYAQSPDFHFKSYRDKRLYLQLLQDKKYFGLPAPVIIDSFSVLREKAKAAGDSELTDELTLYIAETSYDLHLPDDATAMDIKEIIAYARNNNMAYLEADGHQALGLWYNNARQRSASIEQYIEAYNIYKTFPPDEFPPKQWYLYTLGGKFGSIEDYDNALKYLHEALQTSNMGHKDFYCALYNNIGLCLRNKKQYDSAIYYFKLSYEHAVATGNKPYIGISEGNIGISYFLQKKYDDAIPLIKEDIENSTNTRQIKNAVQSMAILATIYNNRQQYDSAETTLTKALRIGESKPFWPDYKVAATIYTQLFTLYAAKNDFHRAWLYADSALIAKDSITALNSVSEMAKAHDQLEFAQHKLEEEQLKIAQLELGKNRIVTISSIAGLAILLIVLLFIARLNNQVTRQKKELESLNDVKNKIFSIISHDLRTPVNSLVSFTQLLENGNIPPEKLNKYAAVLKDNLGYTSGLMENLLNWARSQMQGYKPVFERFDIAETAHQAIALLNVEASKKNIIVLNNIPSNSLVFADINMTSLIIRNLLSNAIKYTPADGAIALWKEEVKDKIWIKVKDTGVGISRRSVDDFNSSAASQPLDSAPGTNKEKGTGLGLMLCKNFASLMHGSITLESEPGKGSTFTLTLLQNS